MDGSPLPFSPQGLKGLNEEASLKTIVNSLVGEDSRSIWESLEEHLTKILMKEGELIFLLSG